ncbi:erythromycin esterase family protein [Longimicrobium sp.]|uniref:erythromycin esterase family protein n=1 Tax=Longimicrobium sp. TaxID=2029185 RepID=UPI002E37E97D|nr:erythromycin esterase family protein [Longimicrobium sp.]HEX6039743.1 erythromycin esterase family protein [Longimicrobium sp.]
MADEERLIEGVARIARRLEDDADLDPLLDRIGDARVVLLGEASHGTREFYTWRDRISRRLITEKGFHFIAVEGDWPDCYLVNRWIKGMDGGQSAREMLHAFERWPTWMWANEEVAVLAEWLRRHNEGREPDDRVGFYGLDVYSLWDSMDVVTRYLEKVDPQAAARARRAYGCFDPYESDVQDYAMATALVPTSCEEEVVRTLSDLRSKGPDYGSEGREAFFNAEQNALVARNAERYYRAMIRGGAASWNVRDTHMIETLERLLQHHGPGSKAIVWEHNTHVGDARATDMARVGMVNVGSLARERWGGDVVIAGFSSHRGSVIAGAEWGAPMQRMPVPDARAGSWEHVFHSAGTKDRLFMMDELDEVEGSTDARGHRAIGVVYHPDRESRSNYVPSVLPYRYDAVLYIDRSHALTPLKMSADKPDAAPETPKTYPSGM